MVVLHIGSSLIYGLCITNNNSYINVTSIIVSIGLAFLTIAGKFSNISRVWSRLFLLKTSHLVRHRLCFPHHCHLHRVLPLSECVLDQNSHPKKPHSN